MNTQSDDMLIYHVEYTDTFGGEANYSWVRRASFEGPIDMPQRAVMRKARALVGLTGVRGKYDVDPEAFVLHPYRSNTVLFVTWIEPHQA